MKLHTCTLFVILALGSASLQAQMPCREDAYGNYICDERRADPDLYPEEEYDSGIPTGIPGIPTPRPTVRQNQSDDAVTERAPVLGGSDDRDSGDEDGGEVYDVTDDGMGNFKARAGDGRILFGLPDPYGELSWRDQQGRLVDCAFDESGRLVCP
ncbi:MAG: hypothetical protein HKN19_13720 [Halioglobus sp.]|nr:hypothetical protein [Halioglobus sp.]